MIYVLSDIHGNLRRFDSIMQQIQLQPEDTLYVLGDVIDRHKHGITILRRIMAMPNAKMLLGNHEHMMLLALEQGYDENDSLFPFTAERWLENWYRNGGEVTHRHLKHLRKDLRQQILDYVRALPLELDVTVAAQHYKLVHAAPPALFAQYSDDHRNRTHFALWKRWKAEEQVKENYTLIFGHTPTRYYSQNKPMCLHEGPGWICIDCGCGYSEDPDYEFAGFGRLCCLRLEDGKVFYSEE